MFHRLWTFIFSICEFLFIIIKTLPRDLTGLYKLLKHTAIIKYYTFCKRDFVYAFRQNVKRYGSKPCFIFEDKSLSFQQVCKNRNYLK